MARKPAAKKTTKKPAAKKAVAKEPAAKKTHKKHVNFALQGGGSHGAYTWGVLERFLEEEDLVIEGISGTSAGAMNAAVLVNGQAKGGRDGAIRLMEKFWRRISDAAAFSPIAKNPLERMVTGWNMDASPTYHWLDLMSRIFSPYEFNPLNLNPLKNILDDMLDMSLYLDESSIKLFVTATHVTSGQARVFDNKQITSDVLLASSCIPFIFQAVQVEGEYYWDGGYMGNPAIWPLIYHCRSEDVMLVQINPIHNEQIPKSAPEIINRLNEITFNSSLIAEMRAIDFVSRLIHREKLSHQQYKDMRMHLIYSREEMAHLNASSKMNTDWDFFQHLREIGREAAEQWLKDNKKQLGVRSTFDIRDKFLCGPGIAPSFPAKRGRAKKATIPK